MAKGLIFTTTPTPPAPTDAERIAALELQLVEQSRGHQHVRALLDAVEAEVIRTRQLVALLMRDWGEHEVYTTTDSELDAAGSLDWTTDEDGRYRISVTAGDQGTEEPDGEAKVKRQPRVNTAPDPGTEPDDEDLAEAAAEIVAEATAEGGDE